MSLKELKEEIEILVGANKPNELSKLLQEKIPATYVGRLLALTNVYPAMNHGLYVASKYGKIGPIKILLSYKANPHHIEKGHDDRTCIEEAVYWGHNDCATLMRNSINSVAPSSSIFPTALKVAGP